MVITTVRRSFLYANGKVGDMINVEEEPSRSPGNAIYAKNYRLSPCLAKWQGTDSASPN